MDWAQRHSMSHWHCAGVGTPKSRSAPIFGSPSAILSSVASQSRIHRERMRQCLSVSVCDFVCLCFTTCRVLERRTAARGPGRKKKREAVKETVLVKRSERTLCPQLANNWRLSLGINVGVKDCMRSAHEIGDDSGS